MKIRVHKDTNYTTISTLHLKRKDMSLKAKGLLSLMLALSDDWQYSINGLCAICQENETAIKTALEELKACGYLVVKKILPTKKNGGRLSYEYDIYEEPQIQQGEKQGVENLGVEFLGVENHGQLNNQYTNTSNTKTSKKRKEEKENRTELTIDSVIAGQEAELQEPLRDFVKMRKAIKKPITTKGLELAVNKLRQMAKSTAEAIEIINQSVMNSWQSFYPLHNGNNKQSFSKQGSTQALLDNMSEAKRRSMGVFVDDDE